MRRRGSMGLVLSGYVHTKKSWVRSGRVMAAIGFLILLGCGVEGTEEVSEDDSFAVELEKATASSDVSSLKEKMIGQTATPLAYVANGLGYGWCGGCRSARIGEDMYRINEANGNVTIAANTMGCNTGAAKWDDRLKIHYRDWQAYIEEMKVYKHNVREITPLFIAEYTVFNNTDQSITRTVKHNGQFQEKLGQTTTLTNSESHKVGVKLTVSAKAGIPFLGETGFSLENAYEAMWQKSTSNATTVESTGVFSGEDSITVKLPPRTKQVIRGYISRKAYNINYYAIVRMVPSLTLEGFMRWRDACGNWHRECRDSEERRHVAVTWGNPAEGLHFLSDMLNKSQNNQDIFDWAGARSCGAETGIEWGVHQLEDVYSRAVSKGKFQGGMKFEKGLSFTLVANNPIKLTPREKVDLQKGVFELQSR